MTLSDARVLIVEDHKVNQLVTVGLLARMGITAQVVADGHQAVFACGMQRFDLVLMDCQMPGCDGFAATRLIREHEQTIPGYARMPIVALTAQALRGDRERCLEAGMDDYLPKPVDVPRFEACIHSWLSYQRPPALMPGQVDVIIDPEIRRTFAAYADGSGQEIYAAMCSDLIERRPLLNTAVAERDFANIALHAHTIKGASGTIGANHLQRAATVLEHTSRNRDERGLVCAWTALQREIAEVLVALGYVESR